jgi:hypothetical protein
MTGPRISGNHCSYASPKLEARLAAGKGRAVFCIAPIEAGEFIALFGGQLLGLGQALDLPVDQRSQCIQIEDDFVIWSAQYTLSTADWINHSCDPNAGMSGQITLVALKNIEPGDEVCYDYAMCDGSQVDEFKCCCGSKHCRGNILGNDWMLPELQARYSGYFSPYLERRIRRRAHC